VRHPLATLRTLHAGAAYNLSARTSALIPRGCQLLHIRQFARPSEVASEVEHFTCWFRIQSLRPSVSSDHSGAIRTKLIHAAVILAISQFARPSEVASEVERYVRGLEAVLGRTDLSIVGKVTLATLHVTMMMMMMMMFHRRQGDSRNLARDDDVASGPRGDGRRTRRITGRSSFVIILLSDHRWKCGAVVTLTLIRPFSQPLLCAP
jgi:hypothetical protein